MSTTDEPITQANPTETQDRTTPPASTPETSTSTTPSASTPETPTRPYNYILALAVIILATIIFGIVMAIYKDVFTEGALVTTAMSTLFGIFGTVVGAYFGIKSSNDTIDKTRKDVAEANDKASRALAALPSNARKRVMGIRP
jgi:hypothetical protein